MSKQRLAGAAASTDPLISEYVAAWHRANTMSDPPDISYSDGWFTFSGGRLLPRRYRRRELERMLETLRGREAVGDRTAPAKTETGA